MKKRFGHIAIILLFFGCTKEEVTPREYPRVSTTEAVDITAAGVTFKGEVIFSSVEIQDHGFVWSDVLGPLVSSANKISLGTKSGIGPFDAKCDRSLESGKKYFMRAYAVSEDFVVYGNTIEFISLGSKAPVVKDFFPTIGTWSDSVTIVGENFSDLTRTNIVKFGQHTATVLEANKDTLLVIVPYLINTESSNVSVTIFGNVANLASKQFTLKAPVIESISPSEGAPGSTVTLTGKFFNGTSTKVYFNGIEGLIQAGTQNSITVKAPGNLTPGPVEVKVVTGSGSMFDITSFTVKAPDLLQLSPASAGEGDEIKLVGSYFSSEKSENIVTFGNINAIVTAATPNELKVIVPPDVNAIEADVKVKIGNGESASVTFSFLAPVVESFTPQRGSTKTEIIITGKNFKTGIYNNAYVGTQQLSNVYAVTPNEIRGYLNEIPTTSHAGKIKVTFMSLEGTSATDFHLPWVQLNDFPGSPLYHSRTLIYNNMAYVGFGGEPMSSQFWRFNPATKQWNQLSNFPGTQRNAPITFTVGSKGYVGSGENLKDLWEYTFANNTWVQKSNLPMTGIIGIGFTLNNAGYLTENDGVNTRLWKYNVSTDSWSVASTCPVAIFDYTAYFVIGNSVYIMGYSDLWKFDAITNQWISVAQNPAVHAGICFSVGNFGYAIVSGGEMYKFNSLSKTWTKDYYALEYYDTISALFSIGGKAYLVNYNRFLEYEPAP